MKKLLATLCFLLTCNAFVLSQTIVEQLQQKEDGKGTVTVNHSKEINDLVNGTKTATTTATQTVPTKPVKQDVVNGKQNQTPTKQDDNKKQADTNNTQKPDSSTTAKNEEEHEPEQKQEPARKVITNIDTDNETNTVDTRKKVLRNAHKITGYRVQIFSGGSSRNDRQKAQNAANKVKAKYPQLPVYVHFYSPSWKCRVGNFRTYKEANTVMKQMKAMGYKQACIVKGKITVQ